MTRSQRWGIAAGMFALATVAVLSYAAIVVSSRAPQPPATDPVRSVAGGGPGAEAAPMAAPERGVSAVAGSSDAALPPITLGARHGDMEAALSARLRSPSLRAGCFGIDLRTGAHFGVAGEESFAAASLIKIPVAVALLGAVDLGEIALDETLRLRAQDIGAGSGSLQYLQPGTEFSIRRLGELMIRRSDNTATNMLIARLGGADRLNALFGAWGLAQTVIRTPLPDMGGTNRTSPRDLVTILHAAVEGGRLKPAARALLLGWMSRSHVRSMIPASAGQGAFVANKTGDIPYALGDAGYVVGPRGRRYVLALQVERPRNSSRAKELIRRAAGTVWESLTGQPSPVFRARSSRASLQPRRPARAKPVRPRSS